MIHLRPQQRGETIVEVLICLAILGLILTTAFVMTNRNQLTNRTAHERSEATKELETQLELLRGYTTDASLPTGTFCLQQNGPSIDVVSSCLRKDLYNISIQAPSDTNKCNDPFTISIEWDSLIKDTKEELKTYYKTCNKFAGNTPVAPLPPAGPYRWESDAGSAISCNVSNAAEYVYGDGADGCFPNGPSVYGRRDYSVEYNTTGVLTGSGQLMIYYRQYTGARTLPLSCYPGYRVKVEIDGIFIQEVLLPISRTDADFSISIPPGTDTSRLKLTWINNNESCSGSTYGEDPDLQLEHVILCRADCAPYVPPPCSRPEMVRDCRRIQDIIDIRNRLEIFADANGRQLPTTRAYGEENPGGWDYSSQGGFLTFLTAPVPVDPINNGTGDVSYPTIGGRGYAYAYYCYNNDWPPFYRQKMALGTKLERPEDYPNRTSGGVYWSFPSTFEPGFICSSTVPSGGALGDPCMPDTGGGRGDGLDGGVFC